MQEKLYAFGSDGAAVMVGGAGGGVVDKLEEWVGRKLVQIHYICHVASLAGNAASKCTKLAVDAEALLKAISSDHSRSAKKGHKLKECCFIFDEKFLRILKFHQVRWLCRGKVCMRVVELMKPLLVHYKKLSLEENHPTTQN